MGLPGKSIVHDRGRPDSYEGSDLQLIRMACDFLAQTGRPTKVNVGRHTFANDA